MTEVTIEPTAQRRQGGMSRLGWHAVALLGFVIAWALFTQVAGGGFLPTPLDVAEALVDRFTSDSTLRHLGVTSRRVAIATILSGLLGIVLGVAMGLGKRAESFFLPYVVVALAIPGPVWIIMALLVLGIGEGSTMTALIISVVPFVTNIAFQGVAARDHKLDEMATLYRLARRNWLRHVVLPQIVPALLAASRTAFALSWKLVVLMEALSTPDGIGAELVHYFRLLQPAQVVAYVAIFICIMMVIEVGVFKPTERTLLRWQPKAM